MLFAKRTMMESFEVSDGWWLSGGVSPSNAVAAYQATGAASYAASKINLANPGTFDLGEATAAPTWDIVTGWDFNSNLYFTTGVIPSASSWSMICRFSDGLTGGFSAVCGSQSSSSSGFFIMPDSNPNRRYSNGNRLSTSTTVTVGVMAMAGQNAYLNGASDGTIPSGGVSAYGIFVGAQNISGSPSTTWSKKIQAVSIYNTTITAGQVAAITTAMNAL